MTKALIKNRKAVSVVIGTVLMILVVMVGMSILFGALVVYSDSYHAGVGSSVLESVTVEDVQFIDQNTVRLFLYNTGKTDVEISNVYIKGQPATMHQTIKQSPYTSEEINTFYIPEGYHGDSTGYYLDVDSPINFEDGRSYTFRVVTLRGTGFEGAYVYDQ